MREFKLSACLCNPWLILLVGDLSAVSPSHLFPAARDRGNCPEPGISLLTEAFCDHLIIIFADELSQLLSQALEFCAVDRQNFLASRTMFDMLQRLAQMRQGETLG